MIHPVISFNGPLWIIFYSYGSYFFRKLQQSFKRKFDGTSTTTTTTATIKKKYFYSYLLIFMKETQRAIMNYKCGWCQALKNSFCAILMIFFGFRRKGKKVKRKVKRKSGKKLRKGSKKKDHGMFRSKRMQRGRPKMHTKSLRHKWKGKWNSMSNKPRQLRRRRNTKKKKRKRRRDRFAPFFLPEY